MSEEPSACDLGLVEAQGLFAPGPQAMPPVASVEGLRALRELDNAGGARQLGLPKPTIAGTSRIQSS
jgi:hypothetical protein